MFRCLVKFVLFLINLLFSIIGLALIGAGIAAVYQLKVVTENLPIDLNLDFVPYAAISLGVIVFLIAFSGCYGAVTETKCLLITYGVCMAVLAAAKIVITIILFLNLENYKSTVQDVVNRSSEDPNQNITFHAIEAVLQCCGTYGPDSYVNEYNLTAPTCCKNPNNDTLCTMEEAFQTGCTTMIGDYVSSFGNLFGYGLIIVFVLELVAMTFSIYIIKTMELIYADDSCIKNI